MIVDKHSASLNNTRFALDAMLSPVKIIISAPIRFFQDISSDFSSQHELIKENANLRVENLLLQSKLQEQYAVEDENQQLRALLKSSSSESRKVIMANLLDISPDPFVRQITINRGVDDGVFIGQPVLDAYGVVGQVVDVNKFTTKIMLLIDSQSAIPVQIKRTGFRAILSGDSNVGIIRMLNVTNTSDVKVGDELITSGLGDRYPYGYPVGTVVLVKNEQEDKFLTIIVKPAAHLNQSRLVLLVWPAKNKIHKKVAK